VDATITIGPNSFLNRGVVICAAERVAVGARVRLGDHACVYDTNLHPVDKADDARPRPVSIGDDVWIGRNAVILPGVEVGAGSVVGANAVVTRSFGAGLLIAGNPARVVKTLDTPEGWVRR
jgi:maltose O-acetyltransferase